MTTRLQSKIDLARAAQRLFLDGGTLSADARLFFSELSHFCRINESGALTNGNGIDPVAHVYRDGKRSVWDHVQSILAVDVISLERELAAKYISIPITEE